MIKTNFSVFYEGSLYEVPVFREYEELSRGLKITVKVWLDRVLPGYIDMIKEGYYLYVFVGGRYITLRYKDEYGDGHTLVTYRYRKD